MVQVYTSGAGARVRLTIMISPITRASSAPRLDENLRDFRSTNAPRGEIFLIDKLIERDTYEVVYAHSTRRSYQLAFTIRISKVRLNSEIILAKRTIKITSDVCSREFAGQTGVSNVSTYRAFVCYINYIIQARRISNIAHIT